MEAHQHSDECYEDQLVCGQDGSPGHVHDSSCYRKVFICGKQAHTHSTECYKMDSSAVAASGSGIAATAAAAFSHTGMTSAGDDHSAAGTNSAMGGFPGNSSDSVGDGLSGNGPDSSREDFSATDADSGNGDFDGAGNDLEDIEEAAVPMGEYADPENDSAEPSSPADGTDFADPDGSVDAFNDLEAGDATGDFDRNEPDAALEGAGPEGGENAAAGNASRDNDDLNSAADGAPAANTGSAANGASTAGSGSDTAAAGTTNVLPEEINKETLSSGYVPQLESLNIEKLLNKHTDFYYFHAKDGQKNPADSAQIQTWDKVKAPGLFRTGTKLATHDLLRAYISYTIPAGSLNETNQIARCRLPANLHLTDDQILAINENVNGIAAQYAPSVDDAGHAEDLSEGVAPEENSASVTADGENVPDNTAPAEASANGAVKEDHFADYQKYLGAEAVEGSRTPDQQASEDTTEYISAVVKAENIYENTLDDNGNYIDADGNLTDGPGRLLGQDLIFIFTPYSIEKNQTTYDKEGNPLTAGEKITGWFACDFNTDQIDWTEAEEDLDHSTAEKTAEIVFVQENKEDKISGITRTLKLVEEADNTAESAEAEKLETTPENEKSDEAGTDGTSAVAADNSKEEDAETAENFKDGTLEDTGDGYRITVDYTAAAKIPADAKLQVREITEASDPEAYKACLEQLTVDSEDADVSINKNLSRFFDITIMNGEEKIEPDAHVSVIIKLDDILKEDNTQEIVHFTEEGPVVMESESDETEGISFETDSFSVYGVVVGTGGDLPDDLNGQTVKIRNGSNYLTGNTYYNDNDRPWRITKTNDANMAAEYTFEATGTPGVYNIYTFVNGQRHDLHINRYDDNKADANLTTSGTMGLTVTKNANGTYGISRTINGNTYYLNQYGGNGGNGFAGWKGDNDGNSKLDFVTGQPNDVTNGGKYMVLIKRTENIEGEDVEIFYIVNNDGTLTPVEAELNDDGSVKCVYVEEPMLWTYSDQHLYHNYDAYSFDMNSSPEEFLYRYLSPGYNNGLTTEKNSDVNRYWDYNHMQTDRALWNDTTAVYDLGSHRLSSGSAFLGTEVGEDGVLHVSGNANAQNAAEVYFAVASKVKPPKQAVNAVNHIDISIVGTSVVDVPLAYGKYYDASGNVVYTVSKDKKKTIKTSSSVDITIDDMKRAVITAYQIESDGTVRNLDDAFYITGYSKNRSTEFSTDQVRIEGSFSTANAMHGEDLNAFDQASGTYKNRLNNRVYYTVTVTKPVTFTLKDENGNDLYDSDRKKMEITIDITMAASFNYWDERNECPPLQDHLTVYGQYVDNKANHEEWKKGGYTTHDGITGMDFVLGGDAEKAGSNIVALEISKLIVDKDGERIKLSDEEDVSNKFTIYCDADGDPDSVNGLDVNEYTLPADYQGYSKLHDKDVKVSNDGMGVVYDYDVTPGMYYVREDKESVPDTVKDNKGETWYYAGTRIETEYVWRDQPDFDGGLHISNTYTKDGESDYNSIPEVLGPYKDSKGRTTYFNQETQKEEQLRNGFLEFFVYNIYTKTGDVTFTKTNGSGTNLKGAVFGLYKKYNMETGEVSDPLTKNGTQVTATSGADGTVTFSDVPAVNYYMKEISPPPGYVLSPKIYLVSVADKTDPDSHTVIFAADGSEVTEIINYPSPNNPEATSSQVEYHKRIDALRDGVVNPDSPHSEEDLTDLYRLYLDYKIKSVQEPNGIDLLFVLDHSGSMNSYQSGGDPRRGPTIERMLNGEDGLVAKFLSMNENNRWAAIDFKGPNIRDSFYRLGNAGLLDSNVLSPGSSWNSLPSDISLGLEGGPISGPTVLTNYTAGFWRAEQFLKNNDDRKKVLIFISDGLPTIYIPCNGTLDGAGEMASSYYTPAEIGGCVDETLDQFSYFLNDVSEYGYSFGENIELYTVGFGYDLIGGGGQTILDNMLAAAYDGTEVNASDHSFGFDDGEIASTAAAIKKVLGGAIGLEESFSNVIITDTLSKYVDIYGVVDEETDYQEILKAAGAKVTMTDPTDPMKTIILYEKGSVTAAGSNILDNVSYNGDNQTVTAVFKSGYKVLPGITYTLSFDVKASDEAYSEYATKGYGITVGDPDTDFKGTEPANATSSGKPGFKSNSSAIVSYDHKINDNTKNEQKKYLDPVIQVFNAPVEFIKTDQNGQPVAGAKFNIYSSGFDSSKSLTDPENIACKINATELVSEVITLDDYTKVALISVEKLKPGIYYLVETDAPDGFKALDGPIKIEVTVETEVTTSVIDGEEHVATKDTVEAQASKNGVKIEYPAFGPVKAGENDWQLKVVNESGYELPSTGGPGTHLLYFFGALLTVLSGVILLARRSSMQGSGR